MNIIITGAAGSMGYYLADFIKNGLGNGHVVYGIGRKRIEQVPWIDKYDSLDLYWQPTSSVTEYIDETKPDIIFHLAAMANVRQSFNEPRKFFANNTDGTLNLFDAVSRSKVRPRIVHCSSSEVYGNVPAERNPIAEKEGFSPVNFYACSKTTQELLCGTYRAVHGLDIVITRAFGYINPKREDLVATAIAKQIHDYERGMTAVIYHGDLTPVRSFCDARDIAEAYWLAGTKCAPGIYNIGSDMPVSINVLVKLLEAAAGHVGLPMEQRESLKRPTDIFACWPDVAKFRAATGWTPKITLTESLKWLMECVRQ